VWLSVLTGTDLLTYVVGPMRHAVLSQLSRTPASRRHLPPGITRLG
jgi:hypothetical protein